MDFDTQDLPSYIEGYDDYCDTSKPVYSTDEYCEMKEYYERKLEEKEEEINKLLLVLEEIKTIINKEEI